MQTRRPSNAEKAMSANARSRNEQGKAEDRGRRQHHPAPPVEDEAKAEK
jgi:hypothetical protein